MKKLLLILALLFISAPAYAQNVQCADRPTSDSSNACANTRFVHSITPVFPTLPLSVANGGTGGTSFTAGLPLIGNGTGPIVQGTRTGNTTVYATSNGTLVNGHCVQIDSSGNFVDSGSACGGGGGGGAPVQIFDTRSAAIGSNIDVTVGSIYLNGYTASGDGGRSQYKRISTPSPVKNWQFQSADGAYWQLAETTVNPKQFGAVCNGTTDDGVKLQTISDYLSAVWGGGTFFMPAGLNCAAATQQITLASKVVVRGSGTITRSAIGSGPLLTSTSDYVDIEDVTLAWSPTDGVNNNDNAIFVVGMFNPVVRNVKVIGAFYIGIEAFKTVGAQIDNNFISGHVNRAIYLVGDSTGIAPSNSITNNTIDGYRIGTTTRLANYGINVNSASSTYATGTLIIGNNVRNTKNHGIGVGGNWSNGIINDNNVTNIQDGAGGGVGILVELADGGTPIDWNISGNSVTSVDGTGIFALTIDTINIIGNTVRNAAQPIWIYDTVNATITANFVTFGSTSGIAVHATSLGSSARVQINDNRSNSNSNFGFLTDNNSTSISLFGNSGASNVTALYSTGTGTSVFDPSTVVSTTSPNTFTAIQTFSVNGAPVVVNSQNSNAAKIQLTDIGVGRGYLGATINVPFTSLDGLGATSFQVFAPTGTVVNYPQLGAGLTTDDVTLSAQGTDTNINISLIPKGTGTVKVPNNSLASNVWWVFAADAVAHSHTGDTLKTALATVTIPGGTLGANGVLRITSQWSSSGSGSSKTYAVEFGAVAYQQLTSAATNITGRFQQQIANRNSVSSQVGNAIDQVNWSNGSGATVTSTLNTASNQNVVFYGTLLNSGDTVTLESYTIEVFHKT